MFVFKKMNSKWGGVLCQNGSVTHISWWSSNLTGTIGTSLANLKNLKNM